MHPGSTDAEQRPGQDDHERAVDRYETIVNTVADGVYQLDLEGRLVAVNDVVVSATGYAREELVGEHVSVLLPDEDIRSMAADIREMLEEAVSETRTHESTVTTADGRAIPVEIRFNLLEEGGEITGTVGVVRDISDRKERERRLRRQRDELSHELDEVLERVSDAVFALDDDCRFAYVNDRAEQLLDRTEPELLGRVIWDELPDVVDTDLHEQFERAMATGEPTTFETSYPPLESWFEVHAYPSETGLSVYFRDVTERKEHEETLRRERDRFTTLFESMPEPVVHVRFVDGDPVVRSVNPAFERTFGHGTEDAVGESLNDLIVPDRFREEAVEIDRRALDLGRSDGEIVRHTPDGEREFLFSGVPIDVEGAVEGIGVYVDITEQKDRERELEQYRALTQGANDAIVTIDETSTIQSVNPAIEDLFGYAPDELVGESLSKLIPGVLTDRHTSSLRRYLQTGERQLDWSYVELRGRHRDGHEIPLAVSFSEVEYDGRQFFTGIVRDVTERKRRERQQEALADLGQLALRADDLDELFDATVERVASVLGHEYGAVFELQANSRSLRLRNGTGWREGYVANTTVGTRGDSPAAVALRSEEPVVVPDLPAEPGLMVPDLLVDHGVTSGVSVAVGPVSDPWGVLATHDPRRRESDEHDVAFLEGVANVLATAIERREHERALARQRAELADRERTLRRTYGVVTDPRRPVRSRIAGILSVLREAIGTDYGAVCRVRDGECTFEVVDTTEGAEGEAGATIPLAESVGGRVVETERTVVLADVQADAPGLAGRAENADRAISCYLGVPVSVGGETYGTFCFYDAERRVDGFSDWEVALAELFGNWVGQALDRHQYVDRLGALNDLNGVVREINEALIRESTRGEMEQLVCDRLAGADSYAFAWIGEVEPRGEDVRLRAEAGVSDYLEGMSLSIDPDHPSSVGPTVRALRTAEMQVVRDVHDDPDYARWRERADAYGYCASAAIPITFEGTVYGVLNVYADRRGAFGGEEREVIGHLGETIGHAIGAIERKRALASDEVVELEFQIEQLLDTVDGDETAAGLVTFERTITLGEDDHLVYGTATAGGVETLETLRDRLDSWEALSIIDERFGETRFELRLSRTPVISIAVEHSGVVERARVEDGDFSFVVHLPPSADVRAMTEAVQAAYPELDIVAQRRTTRTPDVPLRRTLGEELTDRQRTALEAAYFAGFFDWPRGSTGEEVAEALGVAPATFHEHVRNGERKLLASLLEGPTTHP